MTLQSDRPDKAFNVWHSSSLVVKGLIFSSFYRITDDGNWIHLYHRNPNNYMSVNAIFNWTNNSSPVSNMPLTVYMEKGRSSVLRIPVSDSDGDIVRCRNPLSSECSSTMCTYFPYGVLDEVRLIESFVYLLPLWSTGWGKTNRVVCVLTSPMEYWMR